MSDAESPADRVKSLSGDDNEIHRLAGGDLAVTVETNAEQSMVTVATDDARADLVVYEVGVDQADAIEAAYDVERGLDRLLRAPFGGDGDE